MQALLFAHLGKLTLSSTQTGGAFAWPQIVGGDDLTLKLRFTQDQDGQVILAQREVHAIKASIGRQQIAPEDGYYTLKLGAAAESAGVNTTAPIAFNATAATVASALNALTDVALAAKKPFAVSSRDDSYFIAAADRTAVTFACVDNELWPSSKVHIASRDFDEGFGYELRLIQAPVAQVTDFGAIVPEIPTMTQVRAGATNSGVLTTELQQLFVPPENPAGFSFCFTRGFRKTDPIVVGEGDTVENVTALLNAAASDTASGFVDEGELFKAYAAPNGVIIEFAGDMAGVNHDLLGISIIAGADADTTFTLSTKTPAMATLLRKVNTSTKEIAAVLHLTVWLVDEQDDEVYRPFSWHIPLTLICPVNMDDLSAAADVNWNNPLSREAYLQHSPSQVATGNRHYLIGAFGDAAAVEFTINHNLATRYLIAAVQYATAAGQFLQHGTDYEIEIVSDNAIKLIFAAAPALNALIGQITSAAHDANFEPHTHGMDEITGLEDRLTAAEEAIAALQASAAVQSGGTRDPGAGTVIMEQVFRTFAEAYPMAARLDPAITSIAGIDQKTLPGDSDLLGAIHDAAAEALGTPPTPSEANKGKVYQNRTLAEVRINGGGGRASYKAQPGEFVGSDGRRLYALIAPGVHNGAIAFTSDAGTDVVTMPNRTLANGTPVMCLSTTTLPAGIASLTELFVINSAAGSCKLSATLGGSAVNITDAGTGTHYLFAIAGTTTSFFPRDFEREIFIARVSGSALQVKKTMEAKVGIETAILNVATAATRGSRKIAQARWRFVIEIGVDVSEAAPATTRGNLKQIDWQATPIVDEVIFLTRDTAAIHTFGSRIKRTAADAWTVEKNILGFWSASAATLAVADFFLRARLTEFDTEDIADAEGIVILLGPDKTNAGDASNMGKLTIK